MSFLAGVFGGGNQQRPQQQQPQGQQQPQQQPQNGNGSMGPAGQQQQPANSNFQQGNQQQQVPGQGQQTQTGQDSGNPLDAFMQLMTPSKDVLTQQQQQQQQLQQPIFPQIPPEQLQQQISSTNFTQNLNPENIQKALSGDQQAFMNVLNQVAQNAFSANLQMTQGLVERGVTTGVDRFGSTLDSRFRDLQLRNQNSQNPALQHPIGQALLGTVKKQIATANPKLAPDQVHAQAEQMFTQFAQMLVPQQNPGQQDTAKAATNWESFLDLPAQ
jgi:hypothetical protein